MPDVTIQCSEENSAEAPKIRKEWSVPASVSDTFRYQNGLRRLPVPDLSSTIFKYLRSIRPLLDDEEFARSCRAAYESAVSKNGLALQERLIERAKSKANSSWLVDWWNDLCYFSDREPVVFFVSYFFSFKDITSYVKRCESCSAQSAVAAALVQKAFEFRAKLLCGQLPPDIADGKPQCMAQYTFLFNSCRVPKKFKDNCVTFDPQCNHHISVACKGHYYTILVEDLQGRHLGIDELQDCLEAIICDARTLGRNECPVGALSSHGRNQWADVRGMMLDPRHGAHAAINRASLEALESSVLMVCLDDEQGQRLASSDEEAMSERARAFWHGDGHNRFYDKTLQFIVLGNGRAGFLGEHSMADGGPTARLCDYMLSAIVEHGDTTPAQPDQAAPASAPRGPAAELPRGAGALEIRRLAWKLPPGVPEAVRGAGIDFEMLKAQHGLWAVTVEGLGRGGIRALGLPVDAVCQLAIQLAFRRTHGRPVPTYEAASTRGFLHGRTETIRSCTAEAAEFSRIMDDPVAAEADRHAALVAAAARHAALAREAVVGAGVDRHLLGLRLLLREGEPELPLFHDTAYGTSSAWGLSTSTLVSEHFECWGFGEVLPDGYGVAYGAAAAATAFVVTCREQAGNGGPAALAAAATAARSRAARLAEAVRRAMTDVAELRRRHRGAAGPSSAARASAVTAKPRL